MSTKATAMAGWIVAAGLAGTMLAGGFKSPQDKVGVVDMEKVVFESDLGKKNADSLDEAVKARQGVLDFVRTHRVVTAEQAQRLRQLSVKADVTAAEKQELEKVKSDVVAAARDFDALNQKPSPTEADRAKLTDYNTRAQNAQVLLEDWSQQFQQELQALKDQMIADSAKRANDLLKDIAAKEGYTVIFAAPRTALYGTNDLTDRVAKALDGKR